jgi:predicted secreted protein
MGVIKGQNLRLLIGGKCVAFATSCTVHASLNLEESSTKDSTNNFTEQTPTGISWDMSCDALYSVDVDATGVNGINALDTVLAQQKVQVQFEQTQGEKNRVAVSGGAVYSGYAWVNDISINAPNRANVTYTIQMQMNSKPVKGTAVSG